MFAAETRFAVSPLSDRHSPHADERLMRQLQLAFDAVKYPIRRDIRFPFECESNRSCNHRINTATPFKAFLHLHIIGTPLKLCSE